VNFRESTIYLCEVTYSKTLSALVRRLSAWAAVSVTLLVMAGSVAIIPYAHEIAETHSVRFIHALNLAGVAAFALCMVSYMFVIYAALVSRYGKHIIQPRIEALIEGS
jgi:hypothetical protein